MPNRQIQNIRKHRITILRPSLHTQCVLWVWWVKLFFFPSYVEFKMFFLLDPLKIQREKKFHDETVPPFFFSFACTKIYFFMLSWMLLFCQVWLFVTPWTAACQASLSITNSWSLLKLMSIESVMPSNYLSLGHSLLLLPSIFPSISCMSFDKCMVLFNQNHSKETHWFHHPPKSPDVALCTQL